MAIMMSRPVLTYSTLVRGRSQSLRPNSSRAGLTVRGSTQEGKKPHTGNIEKWYR